MLLTVIFAALQAPLVHGPQAQPSSPAPAELEAWRVGERPGRWLDQRVTVCGQRAERFYGQTSFRSSDGQQVTIDRQTALFSGESKENGLAISEALVPQQSWNKLCFTGVVRRLDGWTKEEAERRGIQGWVITDVPYDPQYVLKDR